MTIIFEGQTTTDVVGGKGGQPFTDVPGAPRALVGILYDCNAFTFHVDTYPTWTIYNKFLRAIVPYHAALHEDGSMGDPVRGTQRGGAKGELVASGFALAPPGYVVTALNLRWDSAQEGGSYVKAFQLAFAMWTAQGVNKGMTTLSPWQGGDGELRSFSDSARSAYGLNDANAVPNAPPTTSHGSGNDFWVGEGGCVIGLAGRNGDLLDALGSVWAVPKIVR